MAQVAQRHLTTIHLGGALGRRFGTTWRLNVSSPAEAIRAIDANVKGKLFRYLGTEGRFRHYKVALQRPDQLLDPAREVGNPCGTSDIFIWPTVKGRNSGGAKIIAGIALIAIVALASYGVLGGAVGGALYTPATATTAGSLSVIGSVVAGVGTSLILGGISQLLAPNPNNQQGELNSNNFQGTIAAAQQGGPVPVCYGKALVSPVPVSIWFQAVDYNVTQGQYIGTLQVTGLPGGGYEYVQTAVQPIINDASGGN